MTTTIGKVLAVVVCVLSLGFMGFAIAVYSGGKNWDAELEASDVAAVYQITNTGGENPQWSITKATPDGGSLGTEQSLPHALIKARQDLQRSQQQQNSKLGPAINEAEQALTQIRDLSDRDTAAIQARIEELTQEVAGVEQQVAELSNELTQLMDTAADTRRRAARRREDVMRLQNQLEILRTDIYRLTELKRTLTDELVHLKINNESLRQRRVQLSNQ